MLAMSAVFSAPFAHIRRATCVQKQAKLQQRGAIQLVVNISLEVPCDLRNLSQSFPMAPRVPRGSFQSHLCFEYRSSVLYLYQICICVVETDHFCVSRIKFTTLRAANRRQLSFAGLFILIAWMQVKHSIVLHVRSQPLIKMKEQQRVQSKP